MIKFQQTVAIVGLVLLTGPHVYSQRPGAGSAHDTVRELSRIDMNRAVELQLLSRNNKNAVKEAVKKQISEDFRDLQALNNKMMADAWSQRKLDYKDISGMVGQIHKRAARLRTNLGLPQSNEKTEATVEISTEKDFRQELLKLDQSVMSFVTNPIFQQTNVVELDLANKAIRDLNAVVDLSARLKKVGEKMRKTK